MRAISSKSRVNMKHSQNNPNQRKTRNQRNNLKHLLYLKSKKLLKRNQLRWLLRTNKKHPRNKTQRKKRLLNLKWHQQELPNKMQVNRRRKNNLDLQLRKTQQLLLRKNPRVKHLLNNNRIINLRKNNRNNHWKNHKNHRNLP